MYVQQQIQQPFQENLKLHQQHFPQQAMLQRPFLQSASLSNHFFKISSSFGGEPPVPPPPPKTPVIARTIVEIVIEKAVNIEKMG